MFQRLSGGKGSESISKYRGFLFLVTERRSSLNIRDKLSTHSCYKYELVKEETRKGGDVSIEGYVKNTYVLVPVLFSQGNFSY